MKKVVAIVLSIILSFASVSVFASDVTDANVQKVLSKVTEKISIPKEYGDFNYYVQDYGVDTEYQFRWAKYNDGYDYDSINVTCDAEGRITSYYVEWDGELRLYDVKKQDVIDFVNKAARDLFPEAFANENDKLVLDESSYYVSSYDEMSYSLEFDRIRNSVPVEYNNLNISVAMRDGDLAVTGAYLWYDYDLEFTEDEINTEDIKNAYFDEIPLELIYTMVYSEEKNDFVPSLAYYLSDDTTRYYDLSTGKAIASEYDIYNPYYDFNYRYDERYQYPKYVEEAVKGILSPDDVVNKIKNIPELKYLSQVDFGEPEIIEDWNNTYFYNFSIHNEEGTIDCAVTADATTGELVNVNNFVYDDEYEEVKIDSQKIANAEKNIDKFLNSVCKEKYAQTVETGSSGDGNIVSKFYTRIANGLEFKADYITVEYNIKTDSVQYYNLEFTNAQIPEIKAEVTVDEAEQLILDKVEFKKLYTVNGDKFVKALIPETLNYVDAMTGEVVTCNIDYLPEKIEYSDISGHWVEEPALKLADANIGLSGGKLEPEKDITVGEFFELMFIDGIIYTDDLDWEYYEVDSLIDRFKSLDLLTADVTEDSSLTREDAFKLMVTRLGYGDVAKLDIYKVDYADSHLLSDGKVGYAAILSGMGVISGDGSYLYPDKNLTRAETIAIVYKFLKRN